MAQAHSQEGFGGPELYDQFGSPVNLSTTFTHEGTIVFIPPKQVPNISNVTFYTKTGTKIDFDVKRNKKGEAYLVFRK